MNNFSQYKDAIYYDCRYFIFIIVVSIDCFIFWINIKYDDFYLMLNAKFYYNNNNYVCKYIKN